MNHKKEGDRMKVMSASGVQPIRILDDPKATDLVEHYHYSDNAKHVFCNLACCPNRSGVLRSYIPVIMPNGKVSYVSLTSDAVNHLDHMIAEDQILLERARDRKAAWAKKRVHVRYHDNYLIHWWYRQDIEKRWATYRCNVCGKVIDMEYYKKGRKMTRHVSRSIEAHRREHLADPEQLIYERRYGLD